VVRKDAEVSVMPPVPIEVEVPDRDGKSETLAAEIDEAIHQRLTFRSKVELIQESAFGESGYKTNLTVTRQ
jgi:hypothetical protein